MPIFSTLFPLFMEKENPTSFSVLIFQKRRQMDCLKNSLPSSSFIFFPLPGHATLLAQVGEDVSSSPFQCLHPCMMMSYVLSIFQLYLIAFKWEREKMVPNLPLCIACLFFFWWRWCTSVEREKMVPKLFFQACTIIYNNLPIFLSKLFFRYLYFPGKLIFSLFIFWSIIFTGMHNNLPIFVGKLFLL